MARITDTVKHLIIINVIFWLATLALSKYGIDLGNYLALYYPENPFFQIWQPISSMFMHATSGGYFYSHILFNMLGLWMFGSPLEMRWGAKKFLIFYFVTGIGAALIHSLVNYYEVHSVISVLVEAGFEKDSVLSILKENPGQYATAWEQVLTQDQINDLVGSFNIPAVGASGALYGVLVAFAMLYPNAELMMIFLPIPIKAKYFIPLLLGYDFISGVTGGLGLFGGGIAHFAHLGGALFGFLLMQYWKKNEFNANRWDL